MRARRWIRAAVAVSVIGVLAGCTAGTDERGELEGDAGGVGSTQTAIQVAQVTDVHEETGGTLLEGPTFAADGRLFVVDVMAPPGAPKVITVDTETGDINSVYTDHESGFTSAQFGPHDNRLYLTDIASGAILSIRSDGTDPRTEFSGEVEGSLMLADDLAFDEQGAMYVTDTRGMLSPGWEAHGRVVRIAPDRTVTVLAKDLPSPNGIAFDETGEGLWVAQYNANRIDYYALSDDHTTVEAAYPAVHVSAGRGRVDSTAVDSEGNIYQAFHGLPQIRVFSPAGDLLQIIHAPGTGLESATNIAIRPGSKDGYLTVSGPAGGFIYSFQAAAEGGRQSNGG